MKPAFVRLLLNHEFWVQHKNKLSPEMFVEDAKLVYDTLQWAHDEFKYYRDWETDRKSTRLNSSHRL